MRGGEFVEERRELGVGVVDGGALASDGRFVAAGDRAGERGGRAAALPVVDGAVHERGEQVARVVSGDAGGCCELLCRAEHSEDEVRGEGCCCVVARAVRVVDLDRDCAECAGEVFGDAPVGWRAAGDGSPDAVEDVGRLGAGEGLQRVDAEVDVVERGGAGDVSDSVGVGVGGGGSFGDRGVGDAEKRDVCPGDLLAASEGAVDGEPGCTECFCEHAAEPAGADDGDGRFGRERRGWIHRGFRVEIGGLRCHEYPPVGRIDPNPGSI